MLPNRGLSPRPGGIPWYLLVTQTRHRVPASISPGSRRRPALGRADAGQEAAPAGAVPPGGGAGPAAVPAALARRPRRGRRASTLRPAPIHDRLSLTAAPRSRASGRGGGCILRAPGGPVDLDRYPLRGGPRVDQVERLVRAGVGEQPRALADDHGADEQGDLVDKLVV